MNAALAFEGVHFGYPGRPLFAGLDLAIHPGERVAVLGPNGSGKTTLVRLACGFLRPERGEVRLEGTPVGRLPGRARARLIGTVPQESSLAFDFRVREVVALGRTPYLGWFGLERAADREAIQQAMEAAGVAELAERRFFSLSGGERQRVVLARVLAQQPRVLLLDEPTAHLDLAYRLRLYELVVRLNQERGLTVVVVTHDLDLAARHCERVALLRDGKLYADGPTAEVLTPRNVGEVYGVEARIATDPATGRPWVVPLRPR